MITTMGTTCGEGLAGGETLAGLVLRLTQGRRSKFSSRLGDLGRFSPDAPASGVWVPTETVEVETEVPVLLVGLQRLGSAGVYL